ncbi:low-affinity phosphate transporter [Yamadazyma tenuis]|uniref:SPX domain-containing protein n=1 Tax=Candida tenuis (strain ATCC 10573 / BCRC 21748 / CBS 615 / JCM 9827 / NBRC 10315 / NRRL Y-1498 / VKM Y-70) TaxID=590646 RepID=G3B5P3_CANTC|nr:uncharacterized protein CANTEDRAFT_106477 [Yamadazyma tenuis ATCC 10573]EGV63278.1 hypothetical protein CANTEDRAFT_106477 [Yamadazyma tenuis ATCC 10573]WEJ96907.1 low-affinity phosphate transporter [Yamadazyma tenuis]
MKFSHSLQFNAVPEWSSKYIAYTTLKKLIYSLQRDQLHQAHALEDEESSHLISNEHRTFKDPGVVFLAALDAELKKIDEFYQRQEKFVLSSLEILVKDIEDFEQDLDSGRKNSGEFGEFSLTHSRSQEEDIPKARNFSGMSQTDPGDHSEVTEDENLVNSKTVENYLKSPKSPGLWGHTDNLPPQLLLLTETRILLRKRVIALYTTMSELKSFIELNKTGFKKALKKFDKSLNTNLKDEYLDNLSRKTYVFRDETANKLDGTLDSVIKLYQIICNHGDIETAKSELSIHLREHVVWERNTVWRDMIGLERKNYATKTGTEKNSKADKTVIDTFNLSLKNPIVIRSILITVVTLILLNVSIFEDPQQEKCFALMVCASLLWATETIPLFVTSLLIPLLIIIFEVLKNDDGTAMNAVDSSKYILGTMWNSVILLLLGGFTLAAALSKYQIAKSISTEILSRAGTNPSVVLITIMGIALFTSMWVSNVAAPVLCFSLIQPLLRTLPKDSTFKNALILGIALASNIGGMASPIASPQNIIAIEAMDPQPSWGQWFVIALPVCVVALVLVWVFLLITFKCTSKNTKLVSIRTIDEKFTLIQWYIISVSVSTIVLWCVASKLQGIFGEMGIISLLPIVLFFGPGLLTTEDFNNYPWNIVILAMGGTALGKAVSSSGLLKTIAIGIQHEVEDFSLFGIAITFGLLILIMATFVSHTVAALITVPLVSEIGANLPDPHPRLLIMITALLCSSAMGLPTSGFPNVTAICMTDEFGNPYLTVGTFITRGIPSSIITYFVVITIGFATMKLINF